LPLAQRYGATTKGEDPVTRAQGESAGRIRVSVERRMKKGDSEIVECCTDIVDAAYAKGKAVAARSNKSNTF
jgi:hypothetical protein